MCGRYTNRFTWRELVELYRITEPYIHPISNLRPRYNFAPTDPGVVVRLDKEGRREPVMMRWGLVPSWSKDDKSGAAMINAKAETVAEKPAYRKAFASRPWEKARAAIPPSTKFIRVGVTLLDLSPAGTRQLDLFADDDRERQKCETITNTMDFLNRKFGKRVVSLGAWTPPPGGYAGGKIAYNRIPSAEDFW